MATRRQRRRWAFAAAALAAAVVTGSVLAGQFRSADPERFRADLATGEIMRVADIAAADGLPGRGVFVQATEMGQVCLFDALSASSRQRGGGCNSADDPLGGSDVTVSLAYEGGPAIESVRDARLIGLAAGGVAAVDVVMADGTRRGDAPEGDDDRGLGRSRRSATGSGSPTSARASGRSRSSRSTRVEPKSRGR